MSTIKYIIYARKSSESDERQVQSIDDQKRLMTELASKYSLNVVDIFWEAKSAKEPDKRAQFDLMIKKIKKRGASGVLCWKLDRLARNPDEAGKILGMLQREEIQHIRTSEKDYYSEDNAVLSYLEFGIADQYSRDLSKNVKRGLKSKLEKGWRPGSAATGYLNTKIEARGENYIIVDNERFPILRKAWDLMLTGNYTADQILHKLNDEWGFRTKKTKKMGGKPFSRSALYRMFTNPFYCGLIEHHPGSHRDKKIEGVLFPGKHDPMVSVEEYDRVQMLLGRKGRPRPNEKHTYVYNGGLIKCGQCGGTVSGTVKRKYIKSKKQFKSYVFYYCICAQKRRDKCSNTKYVPVENIENQISSVIKLFTIPPELKNWAFSVLNAQDNEEFEEHNKIVESHEKALQGAKRQLTNLTQMRMKDQIEDEEFEKEKTRLNNEIMILKTKESQINMQRDSWIDLTKKAFSFACNASRAFQSGNAQTKKDILTGTGWNWRILGEKLDFQAQNWLIPLINNKNITLPKNEGWNQQKTAFSPIETTAFVSKKYTGRGRGDLNP